jgi:hypothetical protein
VSLYRLVGGASDGLDTEISKRLSDIAESEHQWRIADPLRLHHFSTRLRVVRSRHFPVQTSLTGMLA